MKKLTGILVFISLFFLTSCGGYEDSLEGCIVESHETQSSLCSRGYYVEDYFENIIEEEGIYIELDTYTVLGQIGATDEEEEEFDVSVYISTYSTKEEILQSELRKMKDLYAIIKEDLNNNEEGIRVHVVLSVHFNLEESYGELLFYNEGGIDLATVAISGTTSIKSMLQTTYKEVEDLVELASTTTSVRYSNTEVTDFTLVLEFDGVDYISSEMETTKTDQDSIDETTEILDTVETIFGE